MNARLLQLLVQADSIPCIATIARDTAGGRLNINADTAAGARGDQQAAAFALDHGDGTGQPGLVKRVLEGTLDSDLTRDDLLACLKYAAESVANEQLFPVES